MAIDSVYRRFLETEVTMKVLVKSAWGSEDPTRAAFPFLHTNTLAEAGHQLQFFLLGELEIDLAGKNAGFANSSILVQLIERADKLLTE